jgi:hypothetical protein
MIGHGPKNIFFDSWPNLRGGRAFPFGADFCGVEPHHRDWSVPKSVSWVALIIAGGLALLGLRLGQRDE